jgi:8-oxo-dGTP pyrophosphatase MutT (NUDIX family)
MSSQSTNNSNKFTINVYHGHQGKYYTINDGTIKYDSHFPIEWAINHWPAPEQFQTGNNLDMTGPEGCANCSLYGSIRNVFVAYCSNCAHYVYNYSRCPYIETLIASEYTQEDLNKLPYMQGVKLQDIGDEEPFINEAVVNDYSSEDEELFLVAPVISDLDFEEKKETPPPPFFVQDVEIVGPDIPVADMQALVHAKKLHQWIDNNKDGGELDTHKLTILKVIWFAAQPTPEKLGFVLCRAHTRPIPIALETQTTGIELPDIRSNVVFIRGNAIALLFLVKATDTGNVYVIYCNQYRPAVHGRCDEICAGMVDAATDNVIGVAIQEAEEELHQKIKMEDLRFLGSYYSSQGVLDEQIDLFWTVQEKTTEELIALQDKQTGKRSEGENIILKVKKLRQFELDLPKMKDAKAEIAFYRAKEALYKL